MRHYKIPKEIEMVWNTGRDRKGIGRNSEAAEETAVKMARICGPLIEMLNWTATLNCASFEIQTIGDLEVEDAVAKKPPRESSDAIRTS
jgi:hypothetical protein